MPKLLLVENDEMSRDGHARRLERSGYDVVVAPGGLQGVETARAGLPDIALMDRNLPSINGWEATRRTKPGPQTRANSVLALLAHARPQDREAALAAGCDDYGTEPVVIERLLTKMARPVAPALEGSLGREAGI